MSNSENNREWKREKDITKFRATLMGFLGYLEDA